jgi:hypothetical protein
VSGLVRVLVEDGLADREREQAARTLRDMGHAAASRLINAGLDPVAVAAVNGHEDATTTLRVCARTCSINAGLGRLSGPPLPSRRSLLHERVLDRGHFVLDPETEVEADHGHRGGEHRERQRPRRDKQLRVYRI